MHITDQAVCFLVASPLCSDLLSSFLSGRYDYTLNSLRLLQKRSSSFAGQQIISAFLRGCFALREHPRIVELSTIRSNSEPKERIPANSKKNAGPSLTKATPDALLDTAALSPFNTCALEIPSRDNYRHRTVDEYNYITQQHLTRAFDDFNRNSVSGLQTIIANA
ncbi:hypothetical protein J6590_033468 [Homalodisca vitripennis]|nr:hypothetical protein J6590_033468 [Homalodisca vitripennis]